jgi:hypothetical protein
MEALQDMFFYDEMGLGYFGDSFHNRLFRVRFDLREGIMIPHMFY